MSPPLIALSIASLVLALGIRIPCPAARTPDSTSVAAVASHARPRRWTHLVQQLGSSLTTAISVATGGIRRRRRQRAIDTAFPDVVELLVLAVHAGASPTRAVHDVRGLVAPVVRPAFDTVVHRLQRGQRLADAVVAFPEQLGHRAVALADGIAAADRYGLPLGPVLDALAAEARADRRRIGDAQARSLSVKLSFPLVVCTLPAFVLVAIVPAVLGSLASLPTSPIT